jgi:hypothetical protein
MWATALATSTSSFQMYYLENFGAWRARWGTYLVAKKTARQRKKEHAGKCESQTLGREGLGVGQRG